MIIKKFSSKTEADAIDIARKELGPDVVIMNVRTIKKKGIFSFFSSPQVEVTVALEEEGEKQPPKAPAMTALEQLAAKQKEIEQKKAESIKVSEPVNASSTPYDDVDSKSNNALEEKLDSIETLIKKRLENEDSKVNEEVKSEPHTEENDQMKLTKLLYNMMIDNEVHEKYANQIIEEAEKANKPNMPVDYFLTNLNLFNKLLIKI